MNIPLIPLVVDVRARRLPPLRVSLLRLMIAVAFLGAAFGLIARLGHLGREAAFHREATRGAGPDVARWHEARYLALDRSHQRIDFLVFMVIVAGGTLVVAAIVGRALDLLLRQSSPNPDPEGPRA